MAGAGKKTFTAGETLTASDVNSYLMEQSVMVFGGTAARSSAIPTPSEGMTTYRTDTQQIESYDGAEWRGMSGLQLVKKQTIGSGVTSVAVTNAFSSTYENYKIVVTGGISSSNGTMNFQLTGSATSYYWGMNYVAFGNNTPLGLTNANDSKFGYVGFSNVNGLTASFEVNNPFLVKYTTVNAPVASETYAGFTNGVHRSSTSYTGFSLVHDVGGGTFTGGTIYVYGYGT